MLNRYTSVICNPWLARAEAPHTTCLKSLIESFEKPLFVLFPSFLRTICVWRLSCFLHFAFLINFQNMLLLKILIKYFLLQRFFLLIAELFKTYWFYFAALTVSKPFFTDLFLFIKSKKKEKWPKNFITVASIKSRRWMHS